MCIYVYVRIFPEKTLKNFPIYFIRLPYLEKDNMKSDDDKIKMSVTKQCIYFYFGRLD